MGERMIDDGGREALGLGRATELGRYVCFLGPIKPPIVRATKQLYFGTVKGIMLEKQGAGPWEGEQGNLKR
jgi:hypothetical protein